MALTAPFVEERTSRSPGRTGVNVLPMHARASSSRARDDVGRADGRLGWRSGAGLVVANMIGAGVLLSTGFMAQSLTPGAILAAWALGAVLALLGAASYASIAAVNGRSGGEYRYLSDYLHPSLGYLAGWGSLLLGFAAPVAVDALAVGAFVRVLVPLPVTGTAAACVVGVTLLHAFDLGTSRRSQDALVSVKLALIVGLIATGVLLGSTSLPDWIPPEAADGSFAESFLLQQYWIAFAFSGWNAAVYVAGEFRDPRRDVVRAVWSGCTIVGLLYLALNWVFVANLDPAAAKVVFAYETQHATLAHALLERLIGPIGAALASGIIVLLFLSAMSAMTFVGPRVYAAMAADGYLPRLLREREGRPPSWSVVLQGGIALAFVLTHDIRQAVESASSVLILFSGLTALCVLRLRAAGDPARPSLLAAVAATAYAGCNAWLLYLGVTRFGQVGWQLAVVVAIALLAYLATRARAARRGRRTRG